MDPENEQGGPVGPTIDWMILADYAEAVNGKVTLVGGGFDRVMMADFSVPYRAYLAAGLRVPWADTNRRIALAGSLETIDGDALDWTVGGEMEAGRPPGLRGQAVNMNIAIPVDIVVTEPVQLVLKLRFGDDEKKVWVIVTDATGRPVP